MITEISISQETPDGYFHCLIRVRGLIEENVKDWLLNTYDAMTFGRDETFVRYAPKVESYKDWETKETVYQGRARFTLRRSA